jgi:transglutaminase/protease-like cytokinesis protein 3
VLVNEATGETAFSGNGATVDCSNAADGYILADYQGDNPKVKIQITKDGGSTYTYDILNNQGFHAFPLSDGSGNYNIAMFLNIEGDQYSQACAQAVQADIADQYAPFLRPNQYCDFSGSTQAVAKAAEIAQGAKSDLKVIEEAFIFVTGHVKYDYDLAANVQSGYVPNVDETLSTGMGICFDYASLTSCMLRSQGIPCQLVVGYAGPAYHAWISVHVEGVGWVANMIQFNGDKWTLMDPTFAASGDRADPNVVGDGENYNPVYYY